MMVWDPSRITFESDRVKAASELLLRDDHDDAEGVRVKPEQNISKQTTFETNFREDEGRSWPYLSQRPPRTKNRVGGVGGG